MLDRNLKTTSERDKQKLMDMGDGLVATRRWGGGSDLYSIVV